MSGERGPVFFNCNVCGRELKWEAESAMGVCVICASEEVNKDDDLCMSKSSMITVSITRREFRTLPLETQRRIMAEQAAKQSKHTCAHGTPFERFCMFCECITHLTPHGQKVRRG